MTDWFRNLAAIVRRHEPADDPQALPRAAAALMLELAVADDGADPAEIDTVHQAMRRAFAIDPAELDELLAQAHTAQDRSVSLYEFTRELKGGLDPVQRAELIEWLWRVAYADARLDAHEEHLIRRLADLLGVPHQEFIRRKLAAKGA